MSHQYDSLWQRGWALSSLLPGGSARTSRRARDTTAPHSRGLAYETPRNRPTDTASPDSPPTSTRPCRSERPRTSPRCHASTSRALLFFTLNREDFSFVIHLDRQPRTSRRREAQTGSRARSGSRSERTLDAVEHSRTLMEWWPFLIFHRGGLRIKVINNTRTFERSAHPVFPSDSHTHRESSNENLSMSLESAALGPSPLLRR